MLILWPWYSKGASDSESEIARLISSGSKSVVVVPSSTRPWRLMAPEQNNRASARLVFPAPPCPTSATLRILAGGKLFTDSASFSLYGLWGAHRTGELRRRSEACRLAQVPWGEPPVQGDLFVRRALPPGRRARPRARRLGPPPSRTER